MTTDLAERCLVHTAAGGPRLTKGQMENNVGAANPKFKEDAQ